MIRVRTLADPGGASRVAVGRLGGALPERAVPSPSLALALRPPRASESGGLVIRGDPAWRTEEERYGRALGEALGEQARLRLERLLSEALGAGEAAIIAVEADAPELRALHWELLAGADGRVLEPVGRAVIARLSSCGDRPFDALLPAAQVRSLVWCPEPEDPRAGRVLDGLRAHARRTGAPAPVLLEPGVRPEPGTAWLLHVVAHGRVGLQQVLVALGGGEGSARGVAQLLGPALTSAPLVHLAVCEGGATLPDEVDGLTGALLDAGARAVLASQAPIQLELGLEVATRLHRALEDGLGVAESVGLARAAVAVRSLPTETTRWWLPRLQVHDLRVLEEQGPVRAWWSVAGWPSPSGEAARLLRRAGALALAGGLGFVGVEHLVLARVELGQEGLGELFAAQLAGQLKAVEGALRCFCALRAGAVMLTPSPRLRRLGEALGQGFDEEALWASLAEDGGSWIALDRALPLQRVTRDLVLSSTGATIQPSPAPLAVAPTRAHALRLEVAGGPQDGLSLTLEPGAWLGRWGGAEPADEPLFRACPATDDVVKGRHLQALGEGRVWLARAARLRRGDLRPVLSEGTHELQRGDQLFLTRGTVLRVVRA